MSKEKIPLIVEVDRDLEDLVEDFLASRKAEVLNLRNAANNGEFELIDRIAHNMIGSGRTYGFDFITDIGKSIRTAAESSAKSTIKTLLIELENALNNVSIKFVDLDD